jgi:thiamine pyrophosphokinase
LRAIIVADGDVQDGRAVRRVLDAQQGQGPPLVVAADGGALKAKRLGLKPSIVVGDGDSLAPDRIEQLRREGVEVIVHPTQKDQSDTELALREALARGAESVVLIGAFGGSRLEHSVANLLLLTLPELSDRDVVLADGPSTVRVIASSGEGRLGIDGDIGDYVSLFALTDRVDGVTTSGLRYPLADATLLQGPTRGLSNELSAGRAEVLVRNGRLAIIHTHRDDASHG